MCTGIRIKAQDGAIICARTLEFSRKLDSQIVVIPRGHMFSGTSLTGASSGLCWTSRYTCVGANAQSMVGLLDGLNEEGLGGGLFYFTGYAQYQESNEQNACRTIAPWELMSWILSSCASVQDVREKLPSIIVGACTFEPWDIVPPIHATIYDTGGDAAIIEYLNGTLHIHDNPLGVCTNAPDFEWHITNLKNYVHLSPYNVTKSACIRPELTPFGQGSGMLGLPGDSTPPSRFIRAVLYTQSVLQASTAQEARHIAFRILDTFNIPQGVVRELYQDNHHQKHLAYESVEWTSAYDLQNKIYYMHTYDNRQLRMLNLSQASKALTKPLFIELTQPEQLLDLLAE